MESVDPQDRYLNPPESPTHSPCDNCGIEFHEEDLTRRNNPQRWLCNDCIAAEDRANSEIEF